MSASEWMAAVRVYECNYLFEEPTGRLTSPCPNVCRHRYRKKLNREKWGEREKCSGIPSHSSPAVILSFNAIKYLTTKYPDWVHFSSTRNKLRILCDQASYGVERSMSTGDEWEGMPEHFFFLLNFLCWVVLGIYDRTRSDMLSLNEWWFIQINNSTRKMIRFKFSVLVHLIWSLYAGPL